MSARGAPDAPRRPKSDREDWRQTRPARAPALSPRRHSRQGCCPPQDPAATTGPNDACAVGKGGLRKQGADRPARRQREGAWRSSAVLLAHERRTFNRPFAPRVELSLGLCEDLQTTAAARSRRASVAHAAVAVARGDRDLTAAPDELQQRRRSSAATDAGLLLLVQLSSHGARWEDSRNGDYVAGAARSAPDRVGDSSDWDVWRRLTARAEGVANGRSRRGGLALRRSSARTMRADEP